MRISVQEAKAKLPEYIRLIETGQVKEIIITRYGKPVAKLAAIDENSIKEDASHRDRER